MTGTINIIRASGITPETAAAYSLGRTGKGLLTRVYRELRHLPAVYPGFARWYFSRVCPELGIRREIFLAMAEKRIAGVAILKKGEENKICTLKVHRDFSGKGIGKLLFEESFSYLEEDRPFFTVSGAVRDLLTPFIKKYRFRLTGTLPGFYVQGLTEFIYNR
ncbi:MAG: GNAT family N-acetyltransferase [Treponema sp.]|jgi:GNAT superfamily N-acetyltransferase|nr:GNAT family N-acetyltransferase [Treponema sp.]